MPAVIIARPLRVGALHVPIPVCGVAIPLRFRRGLLRVRGVLRVVLPALRVRVSHGVVRLAHSP